MYWFRLFQTFFRAYFQPRLTNPNDFASLTFRPFITDIDMFRHMNNARYLVYLEMARWAMLSRLGLLKVALKENWILPIAKIEIQYLRPLKLFQKFEVRARTLHVDGKWLYLYQEFERDGKTVAKAMVKAVIMKKDVSATTAELLKAHGFEESQLQVPERLQKWLDRFKA